MNICMATETIQVVTGGVRCIVEQLNQLVKMGHNVCCFAQHGTSSAFENHFPIYPIKDLYSFEGVVICPWSPVAETVSKGPQKEKFYYIHAYEPLFPRDQKWRDMSYRSYSLPMKIFTTSYFLHQLLETNHRRKVISQLVPGGVDTQFFQPQDKRADVINIGVMNRPDIFRGRNEVMVAMEPIKKKYGDKVNLILFGNDQHATPPKVSYEYSYVFTPTQLTLRDTYAMLHLFINPSWREGFPLPPVEAAACGAAIMTTPWGTSDAWLDGFNCMVIPPRNPQAICDRLDYLISKPEALAAIAQNAYRTSKNYTWEASGHRLNAAIQEGLDDESFLQPVYMGFPDEEKK